MLLVELWGNRHSYILLVGIQIHISILKRILAIPNKTTYSLTI